MEQSTSCSRSSKQKRAQHIAKDVQDSIQPLTKRGRNRDGRQEQLTHCDPDTPPPPQPPPLTQLGRLLDSRQVQRWPRHPHLLSPDSPSIKHQKVFFFVGGRGWHGGLISKRASPQLPGPLPTRKTSNAEETVQKSFPLCRAQNPAVRSPSCSHWV